MLKVNGVDVSHCKGFAYNGCPETFKFKRKFWYLGESRIHLSWGETTGYRDPSF